MFQEKVQKRLNLFEVGQGKSVEISNQLFHLTEKGQGEADLGIHLSRPCILFRNLENKKMQYFKNKKCADYVLFENNEERWSIHIFELKRSVSADEWKKIKIQFAGALQNALALAGVLGISVELNNIELYTVYRNDKLNDAANPARLRCNMHKQENRQKTDYRDWNESTITIDFVGNVAAKHHKIKLDIESGTGECELGILCGQANETNR